MVTRRVKPYLLLLVGIGLAGMCWLELVYRLSLFERYGSHPFLNHVADGYFLLMYVIAGGATVAFLIGAGLAFLRGIQIRGLIYSFAALVTLCYAVVLYCMHERKMLVTYGEYIGAIGP